MAPPHRRNLLSQPVLSYLVDSSFQRWREKGFAFRPAQRWLGTPTGDCPISVLALGAVHGLAGFCSGPILGGILTVAATAAHPLIDGALLAVYALGMALPLLLLAEAAAQEWVTRTVGDVPDLPVLAATAGVALVLLLAGARRRTAIRHRPEAKRREPAGNAGTRK